MVLTDITTDLVNDEYAVTVSSMLYSLLRSCLVYMADCYVNEWWFSCDYVITECVFCVCWQNNIQRLSEKMQFVAFCFAR